MYYDFAAARHQWSGSGGRATAGGAFGARPAYGAPPAVVRQTSTERAAAASAAAYRLQQQQSGFGGGSTVCMQCGLSKPRSQYSKNQFSRAPQCLCKTCVVQKQSLLRLQQGQGGGGFGSQQRGFGQPARGRPFEAPQQQQSGFGGGGIVCMQCGRSKPKSQYSKNQFSRAPHCLCKTCVVQKQGLLRLQQGQGGGGFGGQQSGGFGGGGFAAPRAPVASVFAPTMIVRGGRQGRSQGRRRSARGGQMAHELKTLADFADALGATKSELLAYSVRELGSALRDAGIGTTVLKKRLERLCVEHRAAVQQEATRRAQAQRQMQQMKQRRAHEQWQAQQREAQAEKRRLEQQQQRRAADQAERERRSEQRRIDEEYRSAGARLGRAWDTTCTVVSAIHRSNVAVAGFTAGVVATTAGAVMDVHHSDGAVRLRQRIADGMYDN